MTAATVFISYTHDSLEHKDRVLALSNRLRKEGVDCRIDQYEQSPAEGWPAWCQKKVEQSAYVLVACTETYLRRFKGEEVQGKGYGATWEGHIITQELYEAQGKNVKFIPITFKAQDTAYVPSPLRSATQYELNGDYELLYRRLTNQPLIRMPGLGELINMPLRQTLDPLPALERKQQPSDPGDIPERLHPFATVPPKPPSFLERSEISEPLIERLLSGRATIGITAVEGMGGVGKTMVVLGLCHDPRVRRAFSDGIVWLTIGKESTFQLTDRIRQVALALNRTFDTYSEAVYRTVLQDKAILVVLDDVWTLDDVEPFRLSSGSSQVLYTSRNKDLAGPLGAENQEVGVLNDAQARRFLGSWSGHATTPLPEPCASGILSECKGLALALAMIGAALRGQPDAEWAHLLSHLKDGLLKHVRVRPGGYTYQTLHASIAVSVDALNSPDKERYLRLAVLLEDMAASEILLRALWGGDERSIHETARLFVDRSLARWDAEGNIRLHDIQLDYVRGEHQHLEALALQHSALLLSSHVLRSHPEQFASQMIGRLLTYAGQPGIAAFLGELDACAESPRLRPLRPSLAAAGGQMRRFLRNKYHWALAVAVTADGRRAVFSSTDHTIGVWDLDGNQPPRVLKGHKDLVTAVALSADGKRAVSGSSDKTLRAWDLEGDQPPRVLKGHKDFVRAVALSADGKRAVSGSS